MNVQRLHIYPLILFLVTSLTGCLENRLTRTWYADAGWSDAWGSSSLNIHPSGKYKYLFSDIQPVKSEGTWRLEGNSLILHSYTFESLDTTLIAEEKMKVKVITEQGHPLYYAGVHAFLPGDDPYKPSFGCNTGRTGECLIPVQEYSHLKVTNLNYPDTYYYPVDKRMNSLVIMAGTQQWIHDEYEMKAGALVKKHGGAVFYRSYRKARNANLRLHRK